MLSFTEDSLSFKFPDGWKVSKYDDWSFYCTKFQSCCLGNKAVDFLALDPPNKVLWLIEVKDYRHNKRTKGSPLYEEVAEKVRDTLSAMLPAALDNTHDNQNFARDLLRVKQVRVVLHLELAPTSSKAFSPSEYKANIQQKLRQTLKPIDAHTLVVEMASMEKVTWKASHATHQS